ncbi:MAG: hypothetical protein AUG51_26690 [Acidobacteria bacterium 13_1_20CM_3_53_8]|nr:MAG: hypothetical protein AUG51_26690 [Acidobacteria bacterium 13_1_20CM_3_53_8]
MASRKLSTNEEWEARKVFFSGSLPYERIYISNGLGIGGAPYTLRQALDYVIHLGHDGYKNALASFGLKATFIHELVHVWQGHNSTFPWGFIFNSVYHQGKSILSTGSRSGAYQYTLGNKWSDYNVEQQANIVEDWYIGGMKEKGDPAFGYIQDNIRKSKK